jgi:RimJ/RimL family protein N-acetyltransferase
VLPPRRIECSSLVLRAPARGDALALREAVDSSLPHLRRWVRWAMREPASLEATVERIARNQKSFAAGVEFGYLVFTPGEETVIGSVGLHRRGKPNSLEIGYWIREGWTGRGFATEATDAVTRAGFLLPHIDRLEIRCDPRNVASARIPHRLGYRHVTTLISNTTDTRGEPRDTMIWQMRRAALETTGQ